MFLLIARRPCSFRRRLGKRFVRHSVGFEVQSYQVSGAKGSVERFLRRRPLYPTELRDQVRIYKGFRPFGGPVPDLFSLAGEASC